MLIIGSDPYSRATGQYIRTGLLIYINKVGVLVNIRRLSSNSLLWLVLYKFLYKSALQNIYISLALIYSSIKRFGPSLIEGFSIDQIGPFLHWH